MNTDFFLDLYCTLPKNGPGSSESSLKALNSIKELIGKTKPIFNIQLLQKRRSKIDFS